MYLKKDGMTLAMTFSVLSEIVTLCLLAGCIMRFREQSGSGIFYIWCIGPLCLLLLSHGAYFTKKWFYTIPAVGLALLPMWVVERFDPVLGVILLLAVFAYGLVCLAHQEARKKPSGEYTAD